MTDEVGPVTKAPWGEQAGSVAELLAVLDAGRFEPGETPDEPDFTQLDHGLQCAAVLHQRRPEDLELVVAGLVHDIGHVLAPNHDRSHGEIGANFVRPLLGARVASLVEMHIGAKRFLVATDPSYRQQLSPDSIRTLLLQGEAMSESEVEAFAKDPHCEDAVRLRRADEDAKVTGLVVEPLEAWVPSLEAVAASNAVR